MHSHFSLVAFTLLVQATVGSLWQIMATFLLVQGPLSPEYFQTQAIFLLVLLGGGLVSAMAHLGKPQHSVNSVRNIKQSWLSKEIISVNGVAGMLAVMVASAFYFPGQAQFLLTLCGSLTGALALYSMTRIYLIKTVPTWNHAGTPLAFIGSACLLGGLPALLLYVAGVSIPEPLGAAISLVAFAGYVVGIVFKLLAAQYLPYEKLSGDQRMLPVLQAVGGGGLILTLQLKTIGPGFSYLPVVPVIIILIGEYLNRKQFYASYRRVGL